MILSTQFPGIVMKCTDYFESWKGFGTCIHFLDENDWIEFLKSSIARLIRIELEYLDILKDSFFAFSLYKIVGGYKAMQEFPTNFSIIVVLSFFASIVVPIVFATIHLALNNPHMIFYGISSEFRKNSCKTFWMTTLCCIFSFLNPILLLSAYEGAKERTKQLAKILDARIIPQMMILKDIKSQWVTFIKIELGIK